MLAWIMNTRFGRWFGMVGIALAALAAAVVFGWSKRGQVEATKALEGYKRTRKEMDDVPEYGNDPAAAREFLSKRKQRRDL